LPAGVDASRNRAFTRFLATRTTSRTPFSRTAVSREIVKVSVSICGTYSTKRFSTTT